jgi:RecB family exonuclease
MHDAVPLAGEPFAAALDTVMECVSANFTRGVLMQLLRSPHLRFHRTPPDRGFSAFDRALGEAGYLGGQESLSRLIDTWALDVPGRPADDVRGAAARALEVVRELTALREPASTAGHLDRLLAFLRAHEVLPAADDPLRPRLLRGRAAIFDALHTLHSAYLRYDPAPVAFDEVAAVVRRWIEERTFAPFLGDGGVHVVDAQSAKFGDFSHVQLAGLVEGEWPDAPRRNIFYPPGLLRELGWASEADRIEAIRSEFTDLLHLPSEELVVSTFTLEDDALVTSSPLLDEVLSGGLTRLDHADPETRIFEYEALAIAPPITGHLSGATRQAAIDRLARSSPAVQGATRPGAIGPYAVSAIERYQDCPFKFFAADVLHLEEPVEDDPMRSPRARGRFLHEMFQRFFQAWDTSGHGTITVETLDEARAVFRDVAEQMLSELPEADAALERMRFFGSAVSTGIVETVLRLEATRPAAVRERWLEYRLEGSFSLGSQGNRQVALRGVADRVDLLEGNRLRVIDYKSGAAPAPRRALQAPIYALCAQERLRARDGVGWEVDEAAYISLAPGKRPLVPVVTAGGGDATANLAAARDRLLDLVAGIEDGSFPPRPHELRFCTYCAYPSVCRKDYVGDE